MSEKLLRGPKRPPQIDFPSGTSTVRISLIDTTTHLKAPLGYLMGPRIPGHEFLSCPAFSFLIEHPSGRRLVFDLGIRKDWQNMAPKVVTMVTQPNWEMSVDRNVADILEENGVPVNSVEAVIWSHWHYDHTGDMTTFPPSTKLIVGPKFKILLPPYPENPQSSLLKSDFEGRDLVELSFQDSQLKIGGFKAHDYFGDGSFYVLDAPGHAIGHICGLARTTPSSEGSVSTFVMMGADACHHGGEFRPTQYLPLPDSIALPRAANAVCPGHLFQHIHRDDSANQPFYKLTQNFPLNYEEAEQCIRHVEEMDAQENVFVIIAHDATLLQAEAEVPLYPAGNLNDWKAKNLAIKTRWLFLEDFRDAANQGLKQETVMEKGIVLDH